MNETVKHPRWMYTLDFFFNKVLPKKFIVMILATIFCFLGVITGGQWLIVAGAYAGLNFGQKLLRDNNGNRSNNFTGGRSGDGNNGNRRVHLDAEESREAADQNRGSAGGN